MSSSFPWTQVRAKLLSLERLVELEQKKWIGTDRSKISEKLTAFTVHLQLMREMCEVEDLWTLRAIYDQSHLEPRRCLTHCFRAQKGDRRKAANAVARQVVWRAWDHLGQLLHPLEASV